MSTASFFDKRDLKQLRLCDVDVSCFEDSIPEDGGKQRNGSHSVGSLGDSFKDDKGGAPRLCLIYHLRFGDN